MKAKFAKLVAIVAAVFAIFVPIVAADYSINSIDLDVPTSAYEGQPFRVKLNVDSNSPSVRVQLDIPNGLKSMQLVDQDLREVKEFIWDITGNTPGYYAVHVIATDGNDVKQYTKYITINYNKLDLTVYTSKSIVKQRENFVVTGKVQDRTGIVEGAIVDVSFTGTSYTALTNSNGEFSITVSGKYEGTYNINTVARKNGLASSEAQSIKVSGSIHQQTQPTAPIVTPNNTVTASNEGIVVLTIKSAETKENLNAKIIINGQVYTTKEPIKFVLPVGEYSMEVESEGHTKKTRTVVVGPDLNTKITLSLNSEKKEETATNIAIWILWIAAIVSVATLAGAIYWNYFRNPVEESEHF